MLSSGTHHLSLEHDGRQRRYVVHIPVSLRFPAPVVLAFHGAGGTARIMLHHSRWSHRADVGGFVVIAPEGTPPRLGEKPSFRFNPQLWNLGGASTAAPTGNSDDVGFVRAILVSLPDLLSIDPKRIYLTGFSNGAGLTFRLAVELGSQVAAIGPVAGYPYLKNGPPPRPIPTYYMVGSADPLIPWPGGDVLSPWSGKLTSRTPLPAILDQWRSLSGFLPSHQTANDPTGEEKTLGTAPGSEFRCLLVPGLGHHWPGGRDVGVPQEILGPRVRTFDATERLWAFFQQYSLP
jgi:polyhydroxybutyrate depolymerase